MIPVSTSSTPDLDLPDLDLPGLDPSWSHTIEVADRAGVRRRWHYLDNGVEPTEGTMLCVHGNPTWSYLWRGLIAAAPAGWRVVAPDQLGMGWSERFSTDTEPRTLAERVSDLGTLTEALGVTGPVVTVGHDWGGVISLGWAVDHHDQLLGVVAGNTAVHQPDGDRGPAIIRLAHNRVMRASSCVRTPLFVRGTTLLSNPPLPRDVREAFASPYATAARRRSVGDFVADIPFADDHVSRPELDRIAEGVSKLGDNRVPALFFWGPNDPVFGERYLGDLLERLPYADVHRYQGAGHLVTEDAPQYAGAVAAWVMSTVGHPDVEPVETPAGVSTSSTSGHTTSLWAALEARADDPSPAVVEVGGPTASWGALATRVRELAAGLAADGVRPGDRIGLLLEPSTDLTAVVYAAWRAGAVVVVADKGLGFLGMRRALRSARLDLVVGSAKGMLAARAMGLPCGHIAAADLDDLARRGRHALPPPEPDADAECVVVFTSGATGPAKGVVYRHRQVAAQVDLLRRTYAITPDDRFVAAFAPFALLGPALGITSAVPDIDVTAPASLTAAKLADAALAADATLVFASPAALRTVVATADGLTWSQREALARVRLVMSAGAPVPASLLESLATVLPHAEPHTPYGMTEVLPVADVSLAGIRAAGTGEGVCVGHPVPGVEVTIDPVSAEICVRAAHVKDRYDGLWATERAARTDDGRHRTGDVGHLDDEGRLWVEGRLVHVVTTPDGPVTPVGVEQRVEALDGVDQAAAVGVGPAGTQQLVVVVVRPRRGPVRTTLADLTLTGRVREVAGHPVAAVLVTNRLPLDIRHASKIDRLAVAHRAAKLLAGR